MPSWLLGGTVVAVVVACWNYIRAVWQYMVRCVCVPVLLNDEASVALLYYLATNVSSFTYSARYFCVYAFTMRTGPALKYQAYESFQRDARLCWYRGWPIWFAGSNRDAGGKLYYLRGTCNLDALLTAAARAYDHAVTTSAVRRGFSVTRLSGTVRRPAAVNVKVGTDMPRQESPAVVASCSRTELLWRMISCKVEDIGVSGGGTLSLSQLSLAPHVEQFVQTVRQWVDSRDWYLERSVPWKLGACLMGAPGTGKTALIRALAAELQLPVFLFDLASMDNSELAQAWAEVRRSSPAVAVFEDIDAVFHGRLPVNPETVVTFDALLQCLSGVEEVDGILTVVTTNAAEYLDPALTRPGRAELCLQMDVLDAIGVRRLVMRILPDWLDAHDELVEELKGKTGADVQLRCTQLASQWRLNPPVVCEK